MPVEQSDNTRIVKSSERSKKLSKEDIIKMKLNSKKLSDQLWDLDKVEKYKNILDFYNNNSWGYGISGKQTNYDPRISLKVIESNFNYAKNNVENFVETLLTSGIVEGSGQIVKWAVTPTKIGLGAEAIVSSAPLSTKVTKVTTIPRSEMHIRNTVPGALKSYYIGTKGGFNTYTLNKIRMLSKEQLAKAYNLLEKLMNKKGWRKISHPNLLGPGFTNGRFVVSDLGPGNVGKDWLGRLRLADFSIESVPEFRLAMQRKGGILKSLFKIN